MNNRLLEKRMVVHASDTQLNPSPILPDRVRETVSVVIPCFNEERYIGKALEQLADQFDSDRYEIIVADGLSEDNTRSVIDRVKEQYPTLSVTVVDNPARNIPTALNIGISAARGNIIARMDAHAVPCDGYVKRCVEVLNEGNAGAVGMPCLVRPGADNAIARAIAIAVSHPFGIGDAKYRLGAGGPAQEAVDTVAFACFRKSLWEELGGFNEDLLTNEDYDFNYRIRQSGRDVILDRSGHCDYFARTTLSSLAAQYWRYGGWKAEMLRLHPKSMKLRHAVAPGFVLSLFVLGSASFFSNIARLLLALDVTLYLLACLLASWHATRGKDRFPLLFLMPVVFCTIHFAWGSSFLLGLVRPKS
jgi:cellulose synthase/poly-beta-1,6-N-acetylglucosamine synthase-like glycosyltransferase